MIAPWRSSRLIAFLGILAFVSLIARSATLAQAPLKPSDSDPRGFGQHQAMQKASPFKDLKWQLIGPTNISGRITDVAVATRKGMTRVIYVATASGGFPLRSRKYLRRAPIISLSGLFLPNPTSSAIAALPDKQHVVTYRRHQGDIFNLFASIYL